MTLIDPNLLQLVGLGSEGDRDIADGRHLRWIFNRALGFPRSGFRLLRRLSLVGADFANLPADAPPIRAEQTDAAHLGAGPQVRFASGLTVGNSGGFGFGPAPARALRLDPHPVVLALGAEGALPPIEPGAWSNPAAYVVLTLLRRARSGYVAAAAYHDGRPTLRLVDSASLGIRPHAFALDFADVRRPDEASENRRSLPAGDPFVSETLVLHGGLIDAVHVRGRGACLAKVQWITSRDLLSASGWTELDRYFLPLTDAPAIYPAWSALPGEAIARDRLNKGAPKRAAPWDRETGTDPAILLDAAAPPVSALLERRHLGDAFAGMDAAMRAFLGGEIAQLVPQCEVMETTPLEPDGDRGGPEPMDVTVAPFDLLYNAAIDPNVARLLGLAAVDADDAAGTYDYAVEGDFANLWGQKHLRPRGSREAIERLRHALGGNPADWGPRGPLGTMSLVSLVTGLRREPARPLAAAPDLEVTIEPDAARAPVQAIARLSWQRGPSNLFAAPQEVRVLHAFTRESPAGDVLLHHRDDESRLLLPHLPTPYGVPVERLHLTDRAIPLLGPHVWKVAAMDLFGRVSPDAAVAAEVRDLLAPPAPANPAAILEGDATQGAAWTALRLGFDWLPSQAATAPDLAGFELHLRQGDVAPAAAQDPASWVGLETSPGTIHPPLEIAWPSLAVSGAAAGIDLSASAVTGQDGVAHVSLVLSPVTCPFDADGRARLSAAVRAVDASHNRSGFAVARTARADLRVPPPPSYAESVRWATRADAQNRAFFAMPVRDLPGYRVRVFRAAGVALLAAAGTTAESFAALAEEAKVGLLRTLSATHREPFSNAHEQPAAADGSSRLVELSGSDAGLTVLYLAIETLAGARAPWPTTPAAFIVVGVPRTRIPPPPLVRDLHLGDRAVTFIIAPDVTGATRAFEIYRARDAAAAEDVRRMKPIATLAAVVGQETVFTDDGLFEEVRYAYRAVAVGDEGLRSAPTAAFAATPVARAAPLPVLVESIARPGGDLARRRIVLVAPRLDYAVRLLRRRRFAPSWEPADGVPLRSDGALDFTQLVAAPDPGGHRLEIDDVVLVADADYAYQARVEDKRGRVTSGPPLVEGP